MVPRCHLGDEALDAGCGRAGGQLLQQARADAMALKLVGDDEGRLRERGIAPADVVAERDDALSAAVVGKRPDQRAAFGPVRVEHRLDELLVHAAHAVEAQVESPVGEPGEECEEGVGVGRGRRAQAQGGAVAEDDVNRILRDSSSAMHR